MKIKKTTQRSLSLVTKVVILYVFLLSLMNTNLVFSQEVMYLGGRIDVHTYPNVWLPDVLVRGEGAYFKFPLANYSADEITRACKLFIIDGLNIKAVIWEEVVTIPAWDFIEITISDCNNLIDVSPGNYHLYLATEHSSNLNDVTLNSIMVPVVDGGSGAENPHPITIYDYGTFDSGCTDYHITISSPNSSTTWTAGETYEITWNGNVDQQVNYVSLNLHEGNNTTHTITSNTANDGSFFYTVPENISSNTNYFVTLYSVDGPYINTNSSAFTIKKSVGNYDLQASNISIPSQFQKGEEVTINADVHNIGNGDFDGKLFLSWHDANGNYVTDLASYDNTISPGDYASLSFYSSAIQSDVGDYRVIIKYQDPVTNQYITLYEQAVSIVGINIDGTDLSDPNGTTNTIYSFEDVVTPETIEGVALRSFIVIENDNSGEIVIEEMQTNTKNNTKSSQNFSLDYSFGDMLGIGNYNVSYVAFYDWASQKTKTKTKTNIKSISDLPWYCFWGLTATFKISETEPVFVLIDMTNYVTQEEPIVNYNSFVFSLRIEKEASVAIEDMSVEMRFYNTLSGVTTTASMYYIEAVDLWFLEKTFNGDNAICDYDYRFLLHYNTTEVDYPETNYSPLTMEVLPYFDVLPMDEEGIINETQYFFYSYVYTDNPSNTEMFLHIRNPDYTQLTVELNNDVDHYFCWVNQFDVAGYYTYYYEAIAENGQTFYSDTSNFFVGFGTDCTTIQMPGLVSRDLWCPGCSSDNPGNGMPSHIIIHDTKISNIYELRMSDINDGSKDIRYHYLIDSEGMIYEGLEGGPHKSADHFNCMNGHTISIGFLGDFDLEAPSDKALKSFDLLLEYLCSEYQIDPNGIADHVFYDLEQNGFEVNKDMPQVSLHTIVALYPEHACNIETVGNCPGLLFPSLTDSILPWVQYCPGNSQHTSIELGANVDVTISGTEKSNYKDVSLHSEILSLYAPVVVNIRAILVGKHDTLLIQKQNDVVVSEAENTEVTLEKSLSLNDTLYQALVQYQINDTSMWVSLSSEIYENEVDVEVGTTNIEEINSKNIEKFKNFYLFPNPNNGQFNLNYLGKNKDKSVSRSLSIYTISGRLVFTKELKEKNKIDVSLAPGFYILKVYEGDDVFIEKLIVN